MRSVGKLMDLEGNPFTQQIKYLRNNSYKGSIWLRLLIMGFSKSIMIEGSYYLRRLELARQNKIFDKISKNLKSSSPEL